jgi:hypothetical protein
MTDISTGYKVIRKKNWEQLDLRVDGFGFCPEITAKLLKLGVPIREIPISYTPRSFSDGKKIKWTDGLVAIALLLRFWLILPSKRNRS